MKSMGISIIKITGDHRKIVMDIACKLLDDNGNLKILPAAFYESLSFQHLRLFCHYFARYGLPTIETVEFLKRYIGDHSAIEIGAGCGDLGRALGIPMTDNFCQDWPDVKAHYIACQQPIIRYGKDVERLDALDAAKKYKPDIIIGQWVTNWIDPKLPPPSGGGSMYGIKEDLLLKECKSYVVIGNRNVHGHKPILALPHTEIQDRDCAIKSRANDQSENVIYIWGRDNLES
jgi:hypothetical protein